MFHKLFDGHPDLNQFTVDLSVFYAYFPCFTNSGQSSGALRERLHRVLGKALSEIEGETIPGGKHPFRCAYFINHVDEELVDKELEDRSCVLSALLKAFAHTNGLEHDKTWVVKETSQAVFADNFMRTEPDLKMVNVARDPRDNYSALKAGVDKYYSALGEDEKKTLASLINRARMDFLAARVYERTRPERFLSVRFEDLVTEPENTMARVCDHSDIDYRQELTQPTLLGRSFEGNSHEGKRFSGISGENLGKWQERISEFEAKVIEFWLHDVMTQYGYSLHFPQEDAANAFSTFYEWYNCTYFFHDSFARD